MTRNSAFIICVLVIMVLAVSTAVNAAWPRHLLQSGQLQFITHGYTAEQARSYADGRPLRTCGDLDLEREIRAEVLRIQSFFGVRVEFSFIDDREDKNAYATNDTDRPGLDGAVYLGCELMVDTVENEAQTGVAIIGILGHEMAHVLQFQRRLRLSETGHERHADFMAGYYMAHQQRTREFDLKGFAEALYQVGDYEGSHGTPRERVIAMLAGYRSRDLPLASAIAAGVQFAQAADR
jgi:hypothetical protein